jgi:hypothetical protein
MAVGPFQLIVAAKAKGSTMVSWAVSSYGPRTNFNGLQFQAGETKVISGFALFDKSYSLVRVEQDCSTANPCLTCTVGAH